MEKVNSKSVCDLLVVLEKILARFGIPETIICDNNPFNSWEFKKFAKEWDIEPSFISPYHSQSNGMVEKAVGIIKNLFKKAYEENKKTSIALLEYRNSPITGLGLSPAQLLFNRRLRTKLPVSRNLLKPKIVKNAVPRLRERQIKQKYYFDRSTKELSPLKPGEKMFVQNIKNKTLDPAFIISKGKNPRSYKIKISTINLL